MVDVRVLSQEDAAYVEDAITKLEPTTSGTRIEVSGALEEATVGGGSDGNTTSQHAPTLDGLGVVGGGARWPSSRFIVRDVGVQAA